MLTATPTMGPAVNIICQDRRLVELCDQYIITAILNHHPHVYFDTAQLLAAAAVLRRLEGRLTIVEFCDFMDTQPDLMSGLVALTQDGVGSFDNGIGNFLDFGSGFDGGMMFVTKERFDAVWQFLGMRGVTVPYALTLFSNWDMNIFGEAGIWVKPIQLALDGNTIHD
ncbi:hypothetical protein pEaSNUABM11_00294 [Erwinia phage pEa_SNUABM_11]|nr:hypothetical protein pEaSNUABM11_00294 [Erwinia phage pEa_SNUABM_11]